MLDYQAVIKSDTATSLLNVSIFEYKRLTIGSVCDGTYEAIGIHFQGNPYNLAWDFLTPHGKAIVEVERTFEGIRKWLMEHHEEGLVFWKDGEPKCKIKRTDFGLEWNGRCSNHGTA